jgi:Rps23 Pro-64 3,4-dihydroxylase Tpa1-like proline 4-hydroxylase
VPVSFSLHPAIDVEAAAQTYRGTGRVRIAPFLEEEAAEALVDHLARRADWQLNVKPPGQNVFRLSAAETARWSAAQLRALRASAGATEAKGFRYAYDSIPVLDQENRPLEDETPLAAFAEFLASPGTVDVLRRIVGDERVSFADVFASRYRAGDFLTIHEDRPEGVTRIAAYVFGLTRVWRPEWGGLLLFHDPSGHIEHGLVPAWNSFSLFAVPQDHSVSQVASFAPLPRLSLTGWLHPPRAGDGG